MLASNTVSKISRLSSPSGSRSMRWTRTLSRGISTRMIANAGSCVNSLRIRAKAPRASPLPSLGLCFPRRPDPTGRFLLVAPRCLRRPRRYLSVALHGIVCLGWLSCRPMRRCTLGDWPYAPSVTSPPRATRRAQEAATPPTAAEHRCSAEIHSLRIATVPPPPRTQGFCHTDRPKQKGPSWSPSQGLHNTAPPSQSDH